ncbi:efflux RND transporter periplasmic adaptor subunit [Pelagicoccus sp. SDUM812005]|uniref:efflux RND transporter periplasmic adaptor subunit n=1 Tax=Pelagicoccus sp. SDUM812005 TaxID=3041257 RepID=UPI00280FEEF2|nr:efflux RND transporter periplasmic adaptor subunit [Pelagicoccus sp. SDUM812005]MDQ8181562.1 efflux RND transporter periplasmic adaptor subunit [Pelagicoccus sp. SDUM812005]
MNTELNLDNAKKKRSLIALAVGSVAAIGAGLTMLGCSETEAEVAKEDAARYVETFTVEKHSDVKEGVYVGRVRAPKEVELAFELSGRVDAIAETTGTLFRAGEELGRLDSRRYQLALDEAAQRLAYAEKELARMRTLLDGGSSTQAEFDRVENSSVLARIAWERAKEDLEDTVLVAPFDGKLASKRVEKGSFVMPGQSVLVFQQSGKTEVDFYRTESQLASLLSGIENDVSSVRIADGKLSGTELHLKDYATSPDPLSGAYRVTFRLDNGNARALLPGSPVRLSIVERLDARGNRPVEIPSDALVTLPDGGFRVWVLADGAALPVERSVEVGRVKGKKVEIVRGLDVGDRVVTSGAAMLREHTLVTTLGGA